MGFWDQVVRPSAPAPTPGRVVAPAPAQAPQGPWWAQGQYSGQGGMPQPTQQAYAAQQIPQQQGTWGTLEGSRKRAKSANLNETCPECGSGNFGRGVGPGVTAKTVSQCMDCGYNTRFGLQSGSGISTDRSEGPARPSVQVTGAGYNPGTWDQDLQDGIMDRIG